MSSDTALISYTAPQLSDRAYWGSKQISTWGWMAGERHALASLVDLRAPILTVHMLCVIITAKRDKTGSARRITLENS